MRFGAWNPLDLMFEAIAWAIGLKWRNAQKAYDEAVCDVRVRWPSMDRTQAMAHQNLDPEIRSLRRQARRAFLITIAVNIAFLVGLYLILGG